MNREKQQLSDIELEQALGHFRQSVKAWSEAAHALSSNQMHATESGNPKQPSRRQPNWLTWSIGLSAAAATVTVCALVAVLFTGGHKAGLQPVTRELAQTSARASQHARVTVGQAAARQAKVVPVSAQSATEDDPDAKLLASIDSDISQRTPAALVPMANWMGDSADQ